MTCDCSIRTIDNPTDIAVLCSPTQKLKLSERNLACSIADRLKAALMARPIPAAGLAAPQIGESKSLFVFSYDRDPDHLEAVMNPKIYSLSKTTKVAGWEGCLSVIKTLKVANIARYETVLAKYRDPYTWKKKTVVLKGFAAKVFQHEYDHLQGILNVTKLGTNVQAFENEEQLLKFMAEVKAKDASVYLPPIDITDVVNKHKARLKAKL